MGDRNDLNKRIVITYKTIEIAKSRFHWISRYCSGKNIPATITISFNQEAMYYNIYIDVNEKYIENIKELIKVLDLK